jgi:hypothetical protein
MSIASRRVSIGSSEKNSLSRKLVYSGVADVSEEFLEFGEFDVEG